MSRSPQADGIASSSGNLRNAVWSIADHLVLPLSLLVATPFFVQRLGVHQYGVWMLVNSVIGVLGALSFGFGDATIKYVAKYRASGNASAVARVVETTLGLYTGLGALTGLACLLLAPVLVERVFRVPAEYQSLANAATRVAGAGLLVRAVESVFLSTVRGFERYDLTARIAILGKAATLVAAILLTALGHDVVAILWATVGVMMLTAAGQGWNVRRLAPQVRWWPHMDPATLREVMGFGVWTWLQGLAGILFAHADRLLVAILLGTTSLTYYTVCVQLAQQIHLVLAAGSAYVFPAVSYLTATRSPDLRRFYLAHSRTVSAIAAGLALALALLGPALLRLWMGAEFAEATGSLLPVLAIGYGLFAANSIVPFFVMNGAGLVREQTVVSLGSGLLAAVLALVLLPYVGLVGAAAARLGDGLLRIGAKIYIQRRLLNLRRDWLSLDTALLFGTVSALFGVTYGSAGVLRLPETWSGLARWGVALSGIAILASAGGLAAWAGLRVYHRHLVPGS
jgi:O-antigen/teichoic acid export membrane protein